MLGAERARYSACVTELIGGGVLLETDSEGLYRAVTHLGHQCRDEAGIEATAKHRAQRTLAHHSRGNRVTKKFEQALLVFPPRLRGSGCAFRGSPVTLGPAHLPSVLPNEGACRRE